MEAGDEHCRDDSSTTHLKLAAMAAILASGAIGVCIPLIRMKRQGRLLRTDGAWFAIVKAFAAGVILATGFVHILPDATESLADPSLPEWPWSTFPFSGFAAMMAALGTLVIDFLGTRFYERKHEKKVSDGKGKALASAAGGGEGMHIVGIDALAAEQGHGDTKEAEEDHSHQRHIVVSQLLELGIVSHSVIIGLSLGVSKSPCTIRPLIAALSCHQFFEGFALAGCIAQARFSLLKELIMACFFAITTPGGIAIGLAVASSYNPDSPRAIVLEGILDAISAGILIYMALVDLIAKDFLDRQKMNNTSHQVASYVALFSGAGLMSLLALWA